VFKDLLQFELILRHMSLNDDLHGIQWRKGDRKRNEFGQFHVHKL